MNHNTEKELRHWHNDAMKWAQSKKNHHVVLLSDVLYPPILKQISSPPSLLYIQGDITLLSQPQVAMVGSRNPSHAGMEIAEEFATQLAQTGFIITSGLARGIDTASHKGALNAGGKTIAILGSGLNNIYPASNHALAEKIIENGCLVSEYPLNAKPLPIHFPRRNRIISGLSLGVVIVEAALKSGSLITAQYALEQNREVFAIPGSLRNPASQGCLSLIKNGAKCVMNIQDILDEIDISALSFGSKTKTRRGSLLTSSMLLCDTDTDISLNSTPASPHTHRLDQTEEQVLACIEDEVSTIDQICIRSTLSARLVKAALLELELKGIIQGELGGYRVI